MAEAGGLPYVERSVHLPHTFWCYNPLTTEPPTGELPALRNGHITFGCLNNFCKINDTVLQTWGAVMRAVPNSRLAVLVPRGSARNRLTAIMAGHGITADRLQLADFRPRREYLLAYQQIDLGLDTFPYNGHTTTLDSLWMGVPVVSLVGRTVVGRAGYSMLKNLGLELLAAESRDRFVQTAVHWASDLPKLAQLRSTLRQRMEQSPLMDAAGFTRSMEAAYRWMWQRWCGSAAEASS